MTTPTKKKRPVLVDVKLRRPGCVLLQAIAGGECGLVHEFPNESWLVGWTDDMRLVWGTDEEWEGFKRDLVKRFSGQRPGRRRGRT